MVDCASLHVTWWTTRRSAPPHRVAHEQRERAEVAEKALEEASVHNAYLIMGLGKVLAKLEEVGHCCVPCDDHIVARAKNKLEQGENTGKRGVAVTELTQLESDLKETYEELQQCKNCLKQIRGAVDASNAIYTQRNALGDTINHIIEDLGVDIEKE